MNTFDLIFGDSMFPFESQEIYLMREDEASFIDDEAPVTLYRDEYDYSQD